MQPVAGILPSQLVDDGGRVWSSVVCISEICSSQGYYLLGCSVLTSESDWAEDDMTNMLDRFRLQGQRRFSDSPAASLTHLYNLVSFYNFNAVQRLYTLLQLTPNI